MKLYLFHINIFRNQYISSYKYVFFFRNLDIRDAILQLLNVIRDGNKRLAQHSDDDKDMSDKVSVFRLHLEIIHIL